MSPALHRLGPDPRLVIVCACLTALITFGARAGFGLFLEPMTAANGWSRELFALAIAVQQILWGVSQPVAGAFADRFGPTRVLMTGAVVFFAGMATMAMASEPWMLFLSAGLLIGIGGGAASFGIVMAAAGRLVPAAERSRSLGLIMAASSLGQFLLVPLGQGFILAWGWPVALVLLGALVLLVVPLSLPFRHDRGSAAVAGQTLGAALKEAVGHRSFLLLFAGFFVCGYHVAFIQVHLPAYVVDAGVAAWIGGWALALVGLFNIVGSYSAGVLGGRRSKKNLLSLIYLARAVVIALYVALPISAASTLAFAAAMGLLWLSTVPLTSGLIAVMFGPRYLATLFGLVFLGHQLGAFLGVWLGGYLFDRTGSYEIVWWISIALGLLAAALHWPIEERPVARLQPA
ncbi:MAG TPA: MFS transporter [Geminicoccaceae bacterium]|nr:MFS transporter [Geminicoccaceae bacterium]